MNVTPDAAAAEEEEEAREQRDSIRRRKRTMERALEQADDPGHQESPRRKRNPADAEG